MMRKLRGLALVMAILTLALTGCGQQGAQQGGKEPLEDWAYLESKDKFVIGITIYNPMNFYDENNKLTGFDTEFAEAVCKELGLTPEFVVIDWNTKETELKAKNIDAIWNGLTVTEERRANMDFSASYIANRQVAIVKAANLEKYATAEAMKDAKVAAEGKSAGESAVKADDVLKNAPYTAMPYQSDVLLEVKSGTADVGVIDLVMAGASIGEGTDYSDLAIVEGVELAAEEYAIGFRVGSTETLKKVNDTIQKLADNGTLATIAKKYNLEKQLAVTAK